MTSYRDRTGTDPEQGSAIEIRAFDGKVHLALGVMRNFGSLSEDAWTALSPDEARELARDLFSKADQQDRKARR